MSGWVANGSSSSGQFSTQTPSVQGVNINYVEVVSQSMIYKRPIGIVLNNSTAKEYKFLYETSASIGGISPADTNWISGSAQAAGENTILNTQPVAWDYCDAATGVAVGPVSFIYSKTVDIS